MQWKFENSTVSSGEIDFYDLDTDFEKAKINLNLYRSKPVCC